MVTSSEPRSPIAEIVALISARRRSGSIPTLGIRKLLSAKLFFIDWSINKNRAAVNFVPREPCPHGLVQEPFPIFGIMRLYEARLRVHFAIGAANVPAPGEKDDRLHRRLGAFTLRQA